jgi:hypothetical protein
LLPTPPPAKPLTPPLVLLLVLLVTPLQQLTLPIMLFTLPPTLSPPPTPPRFEPVNVIGNTNTFRNIFSMWCFPATTSIEAIRSDPW